MFNLVNKDAFSSGQIGSKLWLCEELEDLGWSSNTTHIYGGWYGITAFLLLSRGKFTVNHIKSFDADIECEAVADMINANWIYQGWKFKAYTQDCDNLIDPARDLVINTSTEHFDSMNWFHNISAGTRVILQGNNMPHDDHVVHSNSLSSFVNHYPLSEYNYSGSKTFKYETWGFTRYMVIGTK
jgi:hypothetical protein